MSHDDRARWNARHADAPDPGAPSPWLLRHAGALAALAPGRALDVACGRGRNAFALAALGFTVEALDVSDVAVAAVRAEAERCGADVSATRIDLAACALPSGPYAVVLVVRYLQRSLWPGLAASLAPGGMLVHETFTTAVGGMNPDYLLEPGELLDAFAGLDVLAYEEGTEARLLARRPR